MTDDLQANARGQNSSQFGTTNGKNVLGAILVIIEHDKLFESFM